MINRNLVRQVEDLESRIEPVGEPPQTLTFRLVDGEGNVHGYKEFTFPAPDPNAMPSRMLWPFRNRKFGPR